MIKKLMHSSAVLGIVSAAMLSLGFNHTKAWALPTEQILQKLNPVYMFTIADEKGTPVSVARNDVQSIGIFIGPQQAKQFLDNDIKTHNPDLASKLKVIPVNLGEVYQFVQKNQEQNNKFNVAFVPEKAEVESAKAILTKSGKEYKSGVPLFVATVGEEKQFLPAKVNSQEIFPLFFEKKQLDNMLAELKKEKPELGQKVSIEVLSLQQVLISLQTEDNEMLKKVVLIPSVDSVRISLALQKAAQQGGTNQPEKK